MNGNCYYSEGINPALTCNKNEGNRVAIPVLTPDRAQKRQNGRRFKEDGEESFTLTSQDRHGVAIEVKPKMVGYNATLKQGGYNPDSISPECERLQGIVWRNAGDNDRGDVFAIDKGCKPQERDIANCIESREDRGLSRRKQEGTLICHKIN